MRRLRGNLLTFEGEGLPEPRTRGRKSYRATSPLQPRRDGHASSASTSPEAPILPISCLTPEQTAKMKINVELNVQIFRLRKIDNSTEEITLDLGITFMWVDPHLVHSTKGTVNFSTHPSISRFKPYASMRDPQLWPDSLEVGYGSFDPAWKIENCSSMEIVKSICMVIDPSIGLVHNYIHLVATIHHQLDMTHFPFDSQEFNIKIRSEHSDQVMQFVRFADKRLPKIFHTVTTEWVVKEPLTLIFSDDDPAAASGFRYVCSQFQFRAVRKPEWYIYNVFLTSWLIVTASFSVFFIPEQNISERLGITFTTWLLLISLKFVVADRLPKISYFTIMDLYMTFSYFVMIMLVLHTCLMGTLHSVFTEWSIAHSEHDSNHFTVVWLCHFLRFYVLEPSDLYFMLWYFIMWSLFQLFIYVRYYLPAKREAL